MFSRRSKLLSSLRMDGTCFAHHVQKVKMCNQLSLHHSIPHCNRNSLSSWSIATYSTKQQNVNENSDEEIASRNMKTDEVEEMPSVTSHSTSFASSSVQSSQASTQSTSHSSFHATDKSSQPSTQHQHGHQVTEQTKQAQQTQQTQQSTLTAADFSSILQTREEQFIYSQRKLLQSISRMITAFHHLDKSINKQKNLHLINRTIEHLNHLFLIIVVGEFNSGKSRFLNAIIGEKYLKEGRIPTTEKIDIIRYGPERIVQEFDETNNEDINDELESSASPVNVIPKRIHYLNKDLLKGLSFIDSPGVNATITRHEQITKDYIPRADLVIFLTSTERPFSESEREFLLHIREWKKKIIVVVNKSDLLTTEEEKQDVQNFVKKSIKEAIGFEPRIFFVSAQNALERKLKSENLETELYTNIDTEGNKIQSQSGKVICDEWEEMENYMVNSLNINQRIRLKLLSPIGIAERILQKYAQSLKSLQENLVEDFRTIETIDQQLNLFKKDLTREYMLQQNKLDVIFNELITQADEFFDEHITIQNISALLRPEQTALKFDQEVVSHVIPDIEKHIHQLIDWTQEKNLMCWKSVTDFVYRRAKSSAAEEQLIGTIQSEFNFNRKRLLSHMAEGVEVVANAYDSKQHIKKLRSDINSAFSTAGLLSLFSAGAGASTLYLATSQAIAISTGALTGGLGFSLVTAGIAGYAIPYKRQALKQQFRDNSLKLRDRLKRNLEDRFEIQINDMNEQIRSAIAPYSYYVDRRKAEYGEFSRRMDELLNEVQSMRMEIESSYPDSSTVTSKYDEQV